MLSLMIVSVVLGLASAAPQGFPLESADVTHARNAFILEYNRLAALAAAAPDINIIMGANRLNNQHLNHHHQNNHHLNIIPQTHSATQHQQHVKAPVNPAFNRFQFSANLGSNQQFIPQATTFPRAATHQAGHLAGHLAGHQTSRNIVAQPTGPIAKWTGPFADTVPAGVHGLPTQVMDTADVKAAKAAHFAALNAAYQAAPRQQHF